MSKKGTGKFIVGLAVGAGLGLLFAPQKGAETRKQLKVKLDQVLDKAKKIDVAEVKDDIIRKVQEIKEDLANLDKEQAIKIAKDSAKKVQKKAEDLYKYALKKGTPVLQKAADEVRLQAIKVSKEVTKKLEASPKTTKKTK